MGEGRMSMEDRFKELREALEPPMYGSKPKIQKVPFMLHNQKNFEKYYEPMAVAIGPFHHKNPRCKLSQKFKLLLTSRFLEFSGQKDEDLYKKIEEKIEEIRECYSKEAMEDYDDESLAWMLFLDGCSTLQFIYSFVHEDLERFNIKRDQIAFAQQDLFLLENQVPYQVLKLLMSSSNKHQELKRAIESFVQMNIIAPAEKQAEGQEQKQQPDEPTNLDQNQQPDITRSKDQKQQPGATTNADQKKQPDVRNAEQQQNPSMVITMEKEPIHLLDLLRTTMLGKPKEDVPNEGVKHFRGQSFRNVQELDAAGIHFMPSKSNLLGDISFSSCCFVGFLSLPQISVDDSTGPKLMNLIAYEMCPDFQNDFGVTSYIGFLDALIDHANDVKKLRSAHVLYNLLGSDKEVAQLFNEIGTDLVPNSAIYLSVKADIEKHYQTTWKTWMSQCYHDHFSSPWTILAFLGVVSALVLSGIQAWYTVYSPPSPCEALCQYLKTRLHIT